jgi:hypothetical protein
MEQDCISPKPFQITEQSGYYIYGDIAYPFGIALIFIAIATLCVLNQFYTCKEVFQEMNSVVAIWSSLRNMFSLDPTTNRIFLHIFFKGLLGDLSG